jgi:hypothetical protein
MTTVFTLILVKTAEDQFGQPDSTKMFSFGQFFSLNGNGKRGYHGNNRVVLSTSSVYDA